MFHFSGVQLYRKIKRSIHIFILSFVLYRYIKKVWKIPNNENLGPNNTTKADLDIFLLISIDKDFLNLPASDVVVLESGGLSPALLKAMTDTV